MEPQQEVEKKPEVPEVSGVYADPGVPPLALRPEPAGVVN